MLSGWREGTARRPWRISAKLLIISSVVTVIGFSAICVNVMLDMRRGEEALARQTLENLATTIEADISRNIEIYDLSLKAVASNMLLPEVGTVSKSIRQLILKRSHGSRLAVFSLSRTDTRFLITTKLFGASRTRTPAERMR